MYLVLSLIANNNNNNNNNKLKKNPPREKYTGNDGASRQNGTALNKVWSVLVRDGNTAKMLHVNCEWCEEKSCQ